MFFGPEATDFGVPSYLRLHLHYEYFFWSPYIPFVIAIFVFLQRHFLCCVFVLKVVTQMGSFTPVSFLLVYHLIIKFSLSFIPVHNISNFLFSSRHLRFFYVLVLELRWMKNMPVSSLSFFLLDYLSSSLRFGIIIICSSSVFLSLQCLGLEVPDGELYSSFPPFFSSSFIFAFSSFVQYF